MQNLGIDLLFKGKNMIRLLGGLWVAVRISLISVAISITLGLLVGVLMTSGNKFLKIFFRIYLEIVRIMPQMVLLFVVYFGTTRVFGWNLSAEASAIIVFTFWGVAEMGDLVRGALISIPKIQYESAEALDPEMVHEVLEVVLSLARNRSTMLIVTHEMAFAKAIADRVLFLEHGKIVEESRNPKAFFTKPQTERAQQFLHSFEY